MPDSSATPWPVACQASLSMEFPNKNARVSCHTLLQGIFPTQGSNPGLPHFRWTLYCLRCQGSHSSQTTGLNVLTKLIVYSLMEAVYAWQEDLQISFPISSIRFPPICLSKPVHDDFYLCSFLYIYINIKAPHRHTDLLILEHKIIGGTTKV